MEEDISNAMEQLLRSDYLTTNKNKSSLFRFMRLHALSMRY